MTIGTPGVILLISSVVLFAIIVEIFRMRCPKCGKYFARKILKSSSSYQNQNFTSNHTHKNTVHECQCKYCGYRWQLKWTSTKRN